MPPRIVHLLLLVCCAAGGPSSGQETLLPFRGRERTAVTPTNEIVDGRWIVIGNNDKAGGRAMRPHRHECSAPLA